MKRGAQVAVFCLAACAPVPDRPDLTPLSRNTGFVTDGCIPMDRTPDPAMRAVYLDAAQSWLVAPDVTMGPFRPAQFETLALADCGASWLVWNTDGAGAEHPRGSLFVLMSKGTLEFLKLQTR